MGKNTLIEEVNNMNPLKHHIEVIENVDSEIAVMLGKELNRQNDGLNLIASENYAPIEVILAEGNPLTNKYAEGTPKKRYYPGCAYANEVEELAVERAKKLFKVEHVNVQPHSGSQANEAAYSAVLNKGDRVLSMGLEFGGHLSHGMKINFSGKTYNFIYYPVDRETLELDYSLIDSIAKANKPDMIVAGASSYPRIIDYKIFREIADSVGAYLMADIAHIAGLVVGGSHPSPVGYADIITASTHKTLRGPRGGIIMSNEELSKKVDKGVFPGTQGGPHMHLIAAKAVAFKLAMEEDYRKYTTNIINNAKEMASVLMKNGINLTTGGTDNHLMLIDLKDTGKTGAELEKKLEKANIFANRNMIPYDPLPPFKSSGLRIGTPAITTRGFNIKESRCAAELIIKIYEGEMPENIEKDVKLLTEKYPIYTGDESNAR